MRCDYGGSEAAARTPHARFTSRLPLAAPVPSSPGPRLYRRHRCRETCGHDGRDMHISSHSVGAVMQTLTLRCRNREQSGPPAWCPGPGRSPSWAQCGTAKHRSSIRVYLLFSPSCEPSLVCVPRLYLCRWQPGQNRAIIQSAVLPCMPDSPPHGHRVRSSRPIVCLQLVRSNTCYAHRLPHLAMERGNMEAGRGAHDHRVVQGTRRTCGECYGWQPRWCGTGRRRQCDGGSGMERGRAAKQGKMQIWVTDSGGDSSTNGCARGCSGRALAQGLVERRYAGGVSVQPEPRRRRPSREVRLGRRGQAACPSVAQCREARPAARQCEEETAVVAGPTAATPLKYRSPRCTAMRLKAQGFFTADRCPCPFSPLHVIPGQRPPAHAETLDDPPLSYICPRSAAASHPTTLSEDRPAPRPESRHPAAVPHPHPSPPPPPPPLPPPPPPPPTAVVADVPRFALANTTPTNPARP
jgi:hypothetical protein